MKLLGKDSLQIIELEEFVKRKWPFGLAGISSNGFLSK
jgi:hypothetical protein